MNTRNKIISLEQLGNEPAVLIIGTFDPLLPAHAERLAQLTFQNEAKLVVAITDPADPLLDRQARQEMVAALRMVDFVLPYESGVETAVPWTAIYDDTALQHQWSADFKEHVRRRSQV